MARPRRVRDYAKEVQKGFASVSPQLEGLNAGIPENLPPFKKWAKEYLFIRHREGMIVPWTDWTYGQEHLGEFFEEKRAAKEPILVTVPKSRQISSVSTVIAGFMTYLIWHLPERNAMLAAHRQANAEFIFQCVRTFYDYMPSAMKEQKPVFGDRVHKTKFAFKPPHNSQYLVFTGGSEESGRAFAFNYVHVSEYAYMDNGQTFLNGLLPSVPLAFTWDVFVALESTANTLNDFYEKCKAGMNPETQKTIFPWVTKFIAWPREPRCRIQVPAGMELKLDKRDKLIVEAHELDPEQILFMQTMRETVCGGSEEIRKKEYPLTMKECFEGTGRSWFSPEIIDESITRIDQRLIDYNFWEVADWPCNCHKEPETEVKPIFRGHIRWASENLPFVELVPDPYGNLYLWAMPVPGRDYGFGIDGAHGVGPVADYTDISGFDCKTGDQVAWFRSSLIKPEAAAVLMFQLGVLFNWALIVAEYQGPGRSIIIGLMHGVPGHPQMAGGYLNLFHDVDVRQETPEESRKLGWTATKGSKKTLLDDFSADFNAGRIRIFSRIQLYQMRGFAYDYERKKWIENEKDDISGLYNDDSVDSGGLGNMARRRFKEGNSWIRRISAGY